MEKVIIIIRIIIIVIIVLLKLGIVVIMLCNGHVRFDPRQGGPMPTQHRE